MSSSFHAAFILPADSPDVQIGQISEKLCICFYGRSDGISGRFICCTLFCRSGGLKIWEGVSLGDWTWTPGGSE